MTGKMNRTNKVNKKNKKNRVIFRRLFLIITGLIVGFNLYFVNASGILGNQLPMPFGYGLANVLSGSMEPTFSRGTLLLVEDTEEVQKGDIIVYQSEGELIVHRIISLTENEVITQGDANPAADPPFERTKIKGKVVGGIPFLGSAAEAVKKPIVMVVLLACALLLMESSFRAQKDADEQELEAIKEEIRRLKQEIHAENDRKD